MMANDTTQATTISWRNAGLFGVDSSTNATAHLKQTTFTDVQSCMRACLDTEGCHAISIARCGTTPLSGSDAGATGNTTCGPNTGTGDVGLAKACNLWSRMPTNAAPINAAASGPPYDIHGTLSTVFVPQPVDEAGVFVVVEGVPAPARPLLPNCQLVASSAVCGRGQVNVCMKYEAKPEPNACSALKVVGFGSPTVTYAAAIAATQSHPPDESAVGFVMDGAGKMFALMGKDMADSTGNVTLVSGPYTVPKRTSTGERTNTYFTYLRAFSAPSGPNQGKLVVRANGHELVVGQPDPGLPWYLLVLIIVGALLLVVLFAWAVHRAVAARALRHTEASTALHSGEDTIEFVAHPDAGPIGRS